MRFSLLGLITIVTIAGLLISLGATYREVRQTENELAETLTKIEAAEANTAYFQTLAKEWKPQIGRLESRHNERAKILERTEQIFAELVPEESKIVPVEDKISLRSIPMIQKTPNQQFGWAIYVPSSRRCVLELKFGDEEREFSGFKPQQTFPLPPGKCDVTFSSTVVGSGVVLELFINGQSTARANTEECKLNGGSYSRQNFAAQRDFDIGAKRLPKLIRYRPNISTEGDIELKATVELSLQEKTRNE